MDGIFDQSTIYQVQQANDIVDVINEHVNLSNKGREMVGGLPAACRLARPGSKRERKAPARPAGTKGGGQ